MSNKKFIMMSKKLFIPILFAVFFFESSKAQTFRKTDWGINATTLRERKIQT